MIASKLLPLGVYPAITNSCPWLTRIFATHPDGSPGSYGLSRRFSLPVLQGPVPSQIESSSGRAASNSGNSRIGSSSLDSTLPLRSSRREAIGWLTIFKVEAKFRVSKQWGGLDWIHEELERINPSVGTEAWP
jgi:hypothetical protein